MNAPIGPIDVVALEAANSRAYLRAVFQAWGDGQCVMALPEGAGGRTVPGIKVIAQASFTPDTGWFDETLGKWTAENPDRVGFLHVDCDLYSSTMTILEGLKDRLQVGTIITFDEYLNYPGWRVHEYKAWQEFTEAQKISYDYIAFGAKNGPASVKITAIG